MSIANDKSPLPDAVPSLVAEEPYSIFTSREKWFIVSLISFGGLFSPLSANIYFPAIPTLAVAFDQSIELINLTVTLNMVFQGISPMFWGPLSDSHGRRHVFILCLLLLSLSCVGLALTPTQDYWLLLFLRCFQASGSASTVALLFGIIGDIATRAERGGYVGMASLGAMIGPAIGPVLGGVLADKLGWRAIFWFLCISSAVCMVVMILFLPETLRAVVGNGSIPVSAIYRPVIPIIGRRSKQSPATSSVAPKRFQNPLLLLLHVDVALLLVINGVVYSVFYGVTASISTVFHDAYPQLNETELGLCFLSVGGGMVIGSMSCGKLLDWDYQRVRRSLRAQNSTDEQGDEKKGVVDDSFPIEKARMRLMPAFLAVFAASCIGYGWCIDKRTNIAGPLILLIGVGLVVTAIMNSIQTLMLDLMPTYGSSITACNNLVRCSLGAGLVSAIQPLLDALGAGYAYLLLGGIATLMGPLVYVVVRIGPRSRARRIRIAEMQKERLRAKQEAVGQT
ncbi:major facilitator superfamily domain-containing protein [Mycena alexandri]|uniref:Major facilitator superfamily domain-containing protein n=1 Tax=Mycena alexandri TaxID=1745969 RepID=A0AAD6SJH4_9AGAR|nr:major facilitator superfamily domain-containing protein [Mycena alexandri]